MDECENCGSSHAQTRSEERDVIEPDPSRRQYCSRPSESGLLSSAFARPTADSPIGEHIKDETGSGEVVQRSKDL